MKSRNNADQPRDEELQRVEQLLRTSLPPVGSEPEQDRDLWPTMLRRMDEQASRGAAAVPWFDWALGGVLLAFAAVVPRTIPVILYYL